MACLAYYLPGIRHGGVPTLGSARYARFPEIAPLRRPQARTVQAPLRRVSTQTGTFPLARVDGLLSVLSTRHPARGRANPWLRPLRALPRNCASAPPAGTNGPTRHMEDIVMTSHLLYPLILRASPARSGEAHGQSPGAVSGEEIRPPQRERSRAQHCRTRQFSGRHIRAGLHRSHSNLRAWRRVCSPKRPVPTKISTIRLGRKRGELLRARS